MIAMLTIFGLPWELIVGIVLAFLILCLFAAGLIIAASEADRDDWDHYRGVRR